ncbi:hypothetical protein GPECTOR_10g1107 [Gonium pectorale]|uniref:Chitin-binding type-4 domain-containing protein n=1 Tax=Gonium pectorale TaxID=33097 RepID=A0A150GQL6_GONPE|nr:hypothetical protein GPECTOR_10g1107 [Gonium pectorale]|eukprot:KXZ52084.1 hypothetical protein GPECTOR_10g1107 [Gonium pectorale]
MALLFFTGAVFGHGYLKEPVSRNYAARLNNKFWCEHCGQGNGGVPDVCGNPFQGSTDKNFTDPSLWFDGFKANWTSGQAVDVTIYLSTNHGGRMAMRLCPLDRFSITPACFEQPQNHLRRVAPGTKYDGKIYWYLKPSDSQITQTFRLPAGVTCASGCVLQWWWVGYQNCYLPCASPADDVEGECGVSVNGSGQCDSITRTEQFNNCADGYACGECAGRAGSACEAEQCVACLRAGRDAYGCYTASYAALCNGGPAGRRMRRLA